MSELDQVADKAPGEYSKVDGTFDSVVPFAVVHVRLFESHLVDSEGDQDRKKANHKELSEILDGFEEVLNVRRHSSFEFLDFAKWAVGHIGFMFFGMVLGALIGIRIKEIIGCGVLQ